MQETISIKQNQKMKKFKMIFCLGDIQNHMKIVDMARGERSQKCLKKPSILFMNDPKAKILKGPF